MIRRAFYFVFPHPTLSVLIVVTYAALTNSANINTWVMGVFLGIVVPILTRPYWPDRPKTPKIGRLFLYVLLVFWDIIVANIRVAFIILFRSNAKMRSDWIVVPLDLVQPEAITVLAGTITLTPGTVSADLSDEGHSLLVHVLHTDDPQSDLAEINTRYQRRLKEIFL